VSPQGVLLGPSPSRVEAGRVILKEHHAGIERSSVRPVLDTITFLQAPSGPQSCGSPQTDRAIVSAEQSQSHRTPTLEQCKQERAVALVIWLDSLIIPPYLFVGIWAGSLAIVAEVLRGSLLLIVTGFSLRTLRRTHRGLIVDYDYGVGKLERALSSVVALLLLLAAGFIVGRAFITEAEPPPSAFAVKLAIFSWF
jgi:hypothetical protein